MSEQTPLMSDKAVAIGLAEMKAAHRFRNPCRERDGECWTCDILGAAIKALSHAEAAGASVPQEAALREMFRAGISLSETSRSNYLRPDEVEKHFQHCRARLTGEASSAPQDG